MRLSVLTAARNDLSLLRDHYRATLPPAHRIGQTHFSEAMATLARNPQAGIPLSVAEGLRFLPIRFVPFALVYREAGRRVDVLRVMPVDQARP